MIVAPMSKQRVAMLAVTLAAAASRASAQAPAPPTAPPALAIENVTVIPMDSERVLRDHTVDRRGPADHGGRVRLERRPSSRTARRASTAAASFLIPGLAEMHAHFPGAQQVCSSTARPFGDRLLYLNVACGVTTRARHDRRAARPARARGGRARRAASARRSSPPGPRSTATACPTRGRPGARSPSSAPPGYDLLKIHPGVPRAGLRRGGAHGARRGHSVRGPHPGRRRAACTRCSPASAPSSTSTATSRRCRRTGRRCPHQTGFFGVLDRGHGGRGEDRGPWPRPRAPPAPGTRRRRS